MVSDYKDFAEYVLTNFPGAKKVVEVGIGWDRSVYDELKSSFDGELMATDINPGFQDVVKDDITAPNMELYKGSDLIYSIRPPPELYPYLKDTAAHIGAHLIIRPLTTDHVGHHRPINYRQTVILKIL